MTNLVRWDPFSDLRTTMDRLFDDGITRPWRVVPTAEVEGSFPVEISQTDQDIEVKASLPGLKPEDVDISISNDVLTIKGEHREETEDTKRDFYRREIRYGSFQRSFTLPRTVSADGISAEFENGLLKVHMPKAPEAKGRRIEISSGEAR